MTEDAWRFLHAEILMLTTIGAFGRAKIYAFAVTEAQRRAVSSSVRAFLVEVAAQYQSSVPEERHLANIEKLSERVTALHADILRDRRFRIGPAQKALNLYLKYLWCLKRIPSPPDCPLDSIVLSAAKELRDVRWTAMDSIVEYRRCTSALRHVAAGDDLASWELRMFSAQRSSISFVLDEQSSEQRAGRDAG